MALEKSRSIEAELQTIVNNSEPVVEEGGKEEQSWCHKIKIVFTNITVEPLMVCYILPNVMASIATQNLTLEKACRVNLDFEPAICDALTSRNASGYSAAEEAQVQKLVASMLAWKNILQSLLPSLLLLFLGSWSDRHQRRKPCIIYPVVGDIAMTLGLLLCTFFYEWPVEINVIVESIPTGLTGGWFAMFMGVFSYISGITTTENRTLRIGAVNMFANISITIGIALSGLLYNSFGFYGVFSIALSMYVIGLLYGCSRIKEVPLSPEKKLELEMSSKSFVRDFFNVKCITDTMRVAFKEGPKNRRKRICVIMVLVMIIIGPLHGEMNVMYLFVRYKFQWDEIDYSIYSTFAFVLHMVGTLFSLAFFSKYLKLDDSLLGVISSTSKVLSCFVYAFAQNPLVFYLGPVVEMLNGTSFIALRSIISKLVSPEELGKINSLFGVSEALMPLVYGPMYSIVYKASIEVLPGSFFLLGGMLTVPAVVIFFWLYLEHRRDLKEEAKDHKQQVGLLNGNSPSVQ